MKANKSSLPPNPNTAAKLRQNIVTPVDASSLNADIQRQIQTQKKGVTNKLADSVSRFSMNDRESDASA